MSAQTEQKAMHTPGPWAADFDDYATGDSIEVMKEGAAVATVYGADDFPCVDGEDAESCDNCADLAAECEANARLIAASPLMAEALGAITTALAEPDGGEYWTARAFLDRFDIYHDNLSGTRVLLKVAEVALAKALGKE